MTKQYRRIGNNIWQQRSESGMAKAAAKAWL